MFSGNINITVTSVTQYVQQKQQTFHGDVDFVRVLLQRAVPLVAADDIDAGQTEQHGRVNRLLQRQHLLPATHMATPHATNTATYSATES